MGRFRSSWYVWCRPNGLTADSAKGVDSLPDARRRARVMVHARLHLAVLNGTPLAEAAPLAPVKMDRSIRGAEQVRIQQDP